MHSRINSAYGGEHNDRLLAAKATTFSLVETGMTT